MAGWRNAYSLDTLDAEIQTVAPGTTVWTLGDKAHQATWSDHNPNECCQVVCAGDILDNAGLDLQWFVDTITSTDPPALKYVIYRQQIWFPGYGWQPYTGEYHSHAHVSVGWGPDGRSTGPYDDTSPWGLLPERKDEDMPAYLWQGNDGNLWLVTDQMMFKRPVTDTEADTIRYYAGGGDGNLPKWELVDMTRYGATDPTIIPGLDVAELSGGAGGLVPHTHLGGPAVRA